MPDNEWIAIGLVDELTQMPLQELTLGKTRIARTRQVREGGI